MGKQLISNFDKFISIGYIVYITFKNNINRDCIRGYIKDEWCNLGIVENKNSFMIFRCSEILSKHNKIVKFFIFIIIIMERWIKFIKMIVNRKKVYIWKFRVHLVFLLLDSYLSHHLFLIILLDLLIFNSQLCLFC